MANINSAPARSPARLRLPPQPDKQVGVRTREARVSRRRKSTVAPSFPWGRGEPLARKVTRSRLTSRAPAPLPSPRARSPVPAPRRPAAASCSTHLESVPDGRAATRAPGTDSELAKWRRRRGRGGSADTRKGRPAAAGERDRARGGRRRRHGAHTLAHTRSHSTPRPLPARGAARRPRGTVQPVGDCRQLQGRPRPSPSSRPARGPRQPGPDGACKPARLRASPPPGRARLLGLFSPPEGREKKKSAAAAADLAWEGKRVSLVSLLPGSFPPPPSSAAWNRSGARPVGLPPEPPRG